MNNRFYQHIGKRLFDLFAGVIALIFSAPFLVVLLILVRFYLGKSCIFKQERPGYRGKPFILYKFRTMKNLVDAAGNQLPDEERTTRFGNFLRKTSLDELPELINVIKGDMSLIGPRPLLMEYLPLYNHEQAKRHLVKPGMTGWAQVQGRNALTWNEKFKFDIWYVNNLSFLLDLKILVMTLYVVFKIQGIHAENHVTMPKFTGQRKQTD